MGEFRGGSTIGGFPVIHSGMPVARLGGNLILSGNISGIGGNLSVEGNLTISNGEIYVGTNKVFHEGNLVAAGSSTQDFTTKNLTVHGAGDFKQGATFTNDIYVGANKVFHEGNLIASGSSTQDFTTANLTTHGEANFNQTNSRMVIPVGVDKWAT